LGAAHDGGPRHEALGDQQPPRPADAVHSNVVLSL